MAVDKLNTVQNELSPAEKLMNEIEQFIRDPKYVYLRAQPIIREALGILRIRIETDKKEAKSECRTHGSIEHMQSVTGLCPGCDKP